MNERPDRLHNESIGLRELDEDDSSYRVLRFRLSRLPDFLSGFLGGDDVIDADQEEALIRALVREQSQTPRQSGR